MGPHAGMGSSGTKIAAIGLSNKEGADAFVRNSFSIKMWPDCGGLPGEVTFAPACEWQVRNQSASCGTLMDGEEEWGGGQWLVGEGGLKCGSPRMEVHLGAAVRSPR